MPDTNSDHTIGWPGGAIVALAAVLSAFVGGWALSQWTDTPLRSLRYVAIAILMATAAGLGAVRKMRRARDPSTRLSRVSLTEVLVVTSMLAAVFAIFGAEHRQDQRAFARYEHLQRDAAAILGPAGRLGRGSDSTFTITVCDRTFDDQRLKSLARLLGDSEIPNRVSSVMFGTPAGAGPPPPVGPGTPALWPGVTDASVDVLLAWPDLEWLAIDGTSVSPVGRQRLLELEKLNELSRRTLAP